jgi:hypothetical protein
LLRPLAKIVYRIVIDSGWRDGWRGLLKIWLDATSDTLVWIRVLMRRGQWEPPAVPESSAQTTGHGHFGRRAASLPKVVALAGRGEPTQAARHWLARLREEGLDVTLISDEPLSGAQLPTQTVRHLRPLEVMRVIDLEMQIQAIHAVVPFGRRARLVSRLLPGSLRPSIDGLSSDLNPDDALAAIHRANPPTPAS